jgi:NADH-quinone oxidoreductase subunit H
MFTVQELLMLIFHVLVFPGALFCIVIGCLLAGIDRKLVARMQNRKGPPLLQPVYDVLKCCGKETIVPRHARRGLFLGAPVVGFAALITTALFIPVMRYTAFSTGADLVVILYLLTLTSVTMMVGAAASGSPFAGVGLSREMVAMISYELPFVLVLLAVGKVAGDGSLLGCTFSLQAIMEWQAANGSMLFKWSMIPAALAMLMVIPCEIGMHPFDVAEAETEICEGMLAEYSGAPLGVYKLSHAIKMLTLTSLFVALFLGGIGTGIVIVDALILFAVCVVLTAVCISLVHAITARLKIEQIFKYYWTVVSGLALISLVLAWYGL